MTEAAWLECRDPDAMVPLIPAGRHQRELRLFATACARRIWHLLPDECRLAVVASERFAAGEIDEAELAEAVAEASAVAVAVFPGHSAPDAMAYATSAAVDAASVWPRTASTVLASTSCVASAFGCAAADPVAAESQYDEAYDLARRTELAAQADLLRRLVVFPGEPRSG